MLELSHLKIDTHELVGELIDACTWLADRRATAEQFRRAVVDFEKRKHDRLGYTLCSAAVAPCLVQFSLRHTASGGLCASLDVDPATGRVSVQQAWE